jgi:ABC-2 type transport system ATP-binding protein
MIEARGLTKRYGPTLAVDHLDFDVVPGRVTGFLGPNGAGKTTTMRLILGLDHPDGGAVTVNGRPYAQHRFPLYQVGALLDAKAVHGGRQALAHLWCIAQSNRIPKRRVNEVLALVGLKDVAHKRVGGFSLGMSQRLGIAAALLGDPPVLMFDEPVNGLDPEGIVWVRNFFKALAAEGRTVFVSSHLMSEMALTADHLVVIGRGRLIASAPMEELTGRTAGKVIVRTPEAQRLTEMLRHDGATVTPEADGSLVVHGADAPAIGRLVAANGLVLHELTPERASLEDAYFELTGESVEYRGEPTPGGAASATAGAATAPTGGHSTGQTGAFPS